MLASFEMWESVLSVEMIITGTPYLLKLHLVHLFERERDGRGKEERSHLVHSWNAHTEGRSRGQQEPKHPGLACCPPGAASAGSRSPN